MILIDQERKRKAYEKWYAAHREAWLATRRARYAADPTPHREGVKRWQKRNPDKVRARYQRFRDANPGYAGWHYNSTEQRKLGHLVRKALFSALSHNRSGRDWYRNSKLGPLIGCSKPELIAHIEAQFLPGMSWDNHGKAGWEIDHRKPCNAFDLTDEDQLRACFHYTNLQPLWLADNLSKGRR